MATITQLQPKTRPYNTLDRAIEDALTAIAYTFARDVYDRPILSDVEIATALRLPVSMAAVLSDIARAFDLDAPAIVEDALG